RAETLGACPSNAAAARRRRACHHASSVGAALAALAPRLVVGYSDRLLDVHLFHLRRALHDELEARRDLAAHEGLDRLLGPGGVADRDLEERAARRVERRLLERRGVHLAEALEALHLERAAAAVPCGEEPLFLGVVARPEDL